MDGVEAVGISHIVIGNSEAVDLWKTIDVSFIVAPEPNQALVRRGM